MKKLIQILIHSWGEVGTLADRIYRIVLDVSVFIALISLIAGLLRRLPAPSVILTALCLVYMIALQYVTIRRPQHADTCRKMLVVGIQLVLFPAHFFVSGGVHSGLLLFFLAGLGLTALLLRGKLGGITFVTSLCVMTACIVIAGEFPELVPAMTERQQWTGSIVTLVLSGLTIYGILVLVMRAYENERAQNRTLMEQLREQSQRDGLTGLYNRRELFTRLETLYAEGEAARADYYVAMFDADDFKSLNDNYGHDFGDEVLRSISGILRDAVHPESGEMAAWYNGEMAVGYDRELAARYGGEEFVCVLRAERPEVACERVEQARRRVEALRWESQPDVHVSVSGGLMACAGNDDLTRLMHDVDALLYRAKAEGKNRICVHETMVLPGQASLL